MINKNNSQERMKKVAIIPNTNFYNLVPFIKPCNSNHKDAMIEFIYETGIELPIENIYLASSQELAYELVQQGFFVLLSSNYINRTSLTVYLPEQLTVEQKKYIIDTISLLPNCSSTVYSLNAKEELLEFQKGASINIENFTNYVNSYPTYTNPKQTSANMLVKKPE